MTNTIDGDWPGVSSAYDLVEASYDWALQRITAVEGRLSSLLLYAGALAFAAPVVARALTEAPDYSSMLFQAGLVLFAVIAIGSVLGRGLGGARLPTHAILLSERWVNQPEEAYKTDIVDLAGADLKSNSRTIKLRNLLADLLSLLFAAEVVVLSLWVSETF